MTEWLVSSAVLAALLIGAHYLLRGKISARLQYALWLVLLVRLLLPLSGRQSTVLFPDGKEGALERQLRTNAWLRAAGLERGMVYVVCDGLSSQARQEAELFARDRDYLCVLTRAQLCAILKMEREHDEAGRTDDSRHGAERAVSESGKRL